MPDSLLFSMPELLLAMVCVFVTVQIATLCTTVYLHRALSHRAVALARPVEITMRALIWLLTGI